MLTVQFMYTPVITYPPLDKKDPHMSKNFDLDPPDDTMDIEDDLASALKEMNQMDQDVNPVKSIDPETGKCIGGRPPGLTNEATNERRKKVMMYQLSGMALDDIADLLNETGKYRHHITRDIVINDIKAMQGEFRKRLENFSAPEETGRLVIQYDILYEQAMQQFHQVPIGPAKVKFLEMAKAAMDSKHKFLQDMGHIERVSSKKIIDHKHEIINKLNPDQLKQLENQMMKMVLVSQASHFEHQRVPELTSKQKALASKTMSDVMEATIVESAEDDEDGSTGQQSN